MDLRRGVKNERKEPLRMRRMWGKKSGQEDK